MVDLTGKKFGRLTVVGRAEGIMPPQWNCKCDCGSPYEILRMAGQLNAGRRMRCSNCARKSRVSMLVENRRSARSPFPRKLRNVWDSMKRRCYKAHDTFFRYYGGRGISICDEWMNCPESFFKWAIANGYGEGLSIDRINSNGNYEPSNCRWETKAVQSANRRSVINIDWNGKRQSIAAWAVELGVKKQSLWFRIKSGWSVEKAFCEPFR